MRRRVTLALAGFGVVGKGTLQLLQRHKQIIETRIGATLDIKWILSRRKKKGDSFSANTQHTTRWQDIVSDPAVDCVVELIGGTEPARNLVVSALKAGKHIVTANKALLSKHWDEIFNVAHDHRKLVYFEAAVGGGVPVVQALNEGLAGNEINKIVGILNGTTNFILTLMQETGTSFKDALKKAQAAGFAEANPAFDIEGIDAAQKISILGSLATGHWVAPDEVYCEGISKIKAIDLRLIQDRLHSTIKLLGIAEKTEDGWIFRVHPALVPLSHPFANVRNEYNAVALHGDAVGDIMLYGKGAGRFPTSSAVVSDIIFLSRQIANGTAGRLPFVARPNEKDLKLADFSELKTRYYLRVTTLDRPGVLAKITGILGQNHVSIASVHQDTFEDEVSDKTIPIILLTHTTEEANIQASIKMINRLPYVKGSTVLLRME
jgi:homoserine dehydrogenase